MITYRLNQLPPEYGLMGVERTLIYRLLEAGFKMKVLHEAGEIQDRNKAFHFHECEITFLGLPDIIQFINFVGRIKIGFDSITMLEAELKRYHKYPEHPDVPDRLKD